MTSLQRSGYLPAFTAIILFALASRALAQPATQTATQPTSLPATNPAAQQASVLVRMFTQPINADDYAESFLSQVPAPRLQTIIDQLSKSQGAFQSVEPDKTPGNYTIHLASADIPSQITLDSQGRVAGLFFGAPVSTKPLTLDQAITAFANLPGKVSVLVRGDSTVLTSLEPDQVLAVGSTFKLAILRALKEETNSGKHHWDEVVPLKREYKSLPGGILQTWPDNTPLTLATLANQMISISDNTAADTLLAVLGRETVEKVSPRNTPFLSTRQSFYLKANAELRRQYQTATMPDKIKLLHAADGVPLSEIKISDTPTLQIEWFATTNELAALIESVADLPGFTINPGVAKPKDWVRIAYKGGSEPGVLNLTTNLVSRDARKFTVVATWNDTKPLDEIKFLGLYGNLITSLLRTPDK